MTSPEVLFAERHRDQFGRVQANAVDLSTRAWDALGDWTSPGVVDVWADAWLPIDDAAVDTIATATDAYFSMVTETTALDLTGLTAAELRGVTAEEYARRPLATVYTELSKGTPWEAAVRAGRERVAAMVATDASLAQRRVADDWASSGKVVGYRRTLTGKSCVLCAMASTQRYNRRNLMPLHNACDCGVAPIRGDDDPGRVINHELLRDLKASGAAGDLSFQQAASRARKRATSNDAAAERWRKEAAEEDDAARRKRLLARAKNYDARADAQRRRAAEFTAARNGDAKYAVHQHGELGPVITRNDVAFTGPGDLT